MLEGKTMKKRVGFVSNSSTSSFVCYGVGDISINDWAETARVLKKLDPEWYAKKLSRAREWDKGKGNTTLDCLENIEEADKYLTAVRKRTCDHEIDTEQKFCPECGKKVWTEEPALDQSDLADYVRDWLYDQPAGLAYCNSDGWEAMGFSYQDIPDDMTMGEWRKQAHEVLSRILGKEVECHYIEEEIAS
jgi:hypothetical protein